MAEYTIKTGALADSAGLMQPTQRKVARDISGTLFTVYHRSDGTRNQVYCSHSHDDGENWTEIKVTDNAHANSWPSIAIDSSDIIFIVYSGYDDTDTWRRGWCITSEDGGDTWEARTSVVAGNSHSEYLSIAIDSLDYIHVVLFFSVYNIGRCYRSTDNGDTFTNQIDAGIYPTYSNQTGQLTICVDKDDNIYLAWVASTSRLSYRISANNGTDWGAVGNIDIDGNIKGYPTMAGDSSGYVHIVYESVISTYSQLQYRIYTGSWSAATALTSGNYQHQRPTIAIDSNDDISVFFHGLHAGSTTYRQIGYNIYDGSWGGMSWLSSDEAQHRYPNLIWASFPVISTLRINRPKTGYFLLFGEDDVIKCEVSASLTWDSSEPVLQTFVETGAGVDVWTKILELTLFSDTGVGVETLLVDKVLLIEDSGNGVESLIVDKLREFADSGVGVDVFLKDWTPLFEDSGNGVEAYYKVYPYPANLKRTIMYVRDRK